MSEQRKPGRPSKYRPEFASQAEKLCRLGATNEDIADFFGVAVSCIHRWRDAHPEFRDALKDGKDEADAKVEQALFARATGYKDSPPDTTACIFWLKNRQPKKWRDKQEREHSGVVATSFSLTL